jgi:hypothetical protein
MNTTGTSTSFPTISDLSLYTDGGNPILYPGVIIYGSWTALAGAVSYNVYIYSEDYGNLYYVKDSSEITDSSFNNYYDTPLPNDNVVIVSVTPVFSGGGGESVQATIRTPTVGPDITGASYYFDGTNDTISITYPASPAGMETQEKGYRLWKGTNEFGYANEFLDVLDPNGGSYQFNSGVQLDETYYFGLDYARGGTYPANGAIGNVYSITTPPSNVTCSSTANSGGVQVYFNTVEGYRFGIEMYRLYRSDDDGESFYSVGSTSSDGYITDNNMGVSENTKYGVKALSYSGLESAGFGNTIYFSA